jgi:hypothetical protein
MHRAIIIVLNFVTENHVTSLAPKNCLADISVTVFVVKFVLRNVRLVPESKYLTITDKQGKNGIRKGTVDIP